MEEEIYRSRLQKLENWQESGMVKERLKNGERKTMPFFRLSRK